MGRGRMAPVWLRLGLQRVDVHVPRRVQDRAGRGCTAYEGTMLSFCLTSLFFFCYIFFV
jgi:hypothetical protein